MLPKYTGGSTLDERYPSQFEQIGFGSRFESVAHVLQRGFEHSPSHPIAEEDHAGREAFAGLRKCLYEPSRNLKAASDNVDRNLVAEVTKLEGRVETAISPSKIDFLSGVLRERLRAVSPSPNQP